MEEQWLSIINSFGSSAPCVAILGVIVWRLWSTLDSRDKAMSALLDRYHEDINKVSSLLDKILIKLKINE